VHGTGLFLPDGAAKDEFIIEYTGEVCRWRLPRRFLVFDRCVLLLVQKIGREGEGSRGEVYHKLRLSFLFELEKHNVLDAFRVVRAWCYCILLLCALTPGHTGKQGAIYQPLHHPQLLCPVPAFTFLGSCCLPLIYVTPINSHLRVRNVPRIGVFAARAVRPGEELTFNYGDDFLLRGGLDPAPNAAPADTSSGNESGEEASVLFVRGESGAASLPPPPSPPSPPLSVAHTHPAPSADRTRMCVKRVIEPTEHRRKRVEL
jgi:hypothetical protein